jgi:magnesium chelatase family protein
LLETVAEPDEAGRALIRQAAETLKLSARGFHRTLRVARTLADLDGADTIARIHIAEALSYRGETLRADGSRQEAHGNRNGIAVK